MMEKKQQTIPTELINVRFYENQKRQALTTSEQGKTDGEDTASLEGSSSITELCEEHKTPSASSSSSLAISAPSDKSRKGSVDQRIWNLVNQINEEKDSFFTTSSCSGRIILYTWESGDSSSSLDVAKQKKGCKWLLVSHDDVQPDELYNAYLSHDNGNGNSGSRDEEDVYFKMEPCILHVQCRKLSQARKLVHLATESGFRNSGMVIGKENRITVAIRSAMGLEVPLPSSIRNGLNGFVTKDYFNYITSTGNAKMKENWIRTEKLTCLFSSSSWKD